MKTKSLLSEIEKFRDIIFEQENDESSAENTGNENQDSNVNSSDPYAQQLSPQNIGQVYELTKIYTRLKSLDGFLLKVPDKNTVKIRKLVKSSLDIFKVLVDNIEQYKDRLDTIIVMYYQFIKRLILVIKEYFNIKVKNKQEVKNAK